MKKIILLIALIMSVAFTVNAQNTQKPQQIVVNTDDLTPDQLAKVQARNKVEQVTEQLETYSKYAGMGKEVGVAVKEGLGAVKDVTLEFADSDVGKLTMGLIVWKVIGDDIVGIVIGIPLWLLGMILLVWSYRKTSVSRRRLTSREGGWWIFGGKKQYEFRDAQYEDGWGAVFHLGVMMIYTGVMFGQVIF